MTGIQPRSSLAFFLGFNCYSFPISPTVLLIALLLSAESAQRPSYPSSKSKKDWDKLEAEVKKEVSTMHMVQRFTACGHSLNSGNY